ncbi:MAG: flagellar basal-body rod protein FlgF [Rhodospirillaceae bacterium]|nr:MAG: flagellar basal-body rod protein FlgF [Rhodospirillaceae bacterium]
METPTYIALSRQMVLQRQMDVVANNLANANTPGFKTEELVSSEYKIKAGQPLKLSYVQDFATARDFRDGPLKPTGNDLDLAIQGDGFFVVQTPQGNRYTRMGRFQLDADGQIVTSQGYPVLAGGAPIVINPDDGPINVAEDGSISTDRARDGTQQQVVGRLDIVSFADRNAMTPEGENLFSAGSQVARPVNTDLGTANVGLPIDGTATPGSATKIMRGMLEDSNVKTIAEMTNMIQVTRNYQSTQNFLDTEHQRLMKAIDQISTNS